ncbi:MAG: beta-lactamase family protein [Streptococcaceae bacterium]|jgi:CubicO group peptidase (beta-lactamase class C family)|nr:beta-lactamase family protein [Streptococcaceae bacterium]
MLKLIRRIVLFTLLIMMLIIDPLSANEKVAIQAKGTDAPTSTLINNEADLTDYLKKANQNQKYTDGLLAFMHYHQISGECVIRRNGQVIAVASTGYVDKNSEKQITNNQPMAIASISKTFCGVVIERLVEQGKMSYDDLLSKYLSDVEGADEVTIRQLLTHTSGFQNKEIEPEQRLKTQAAVEDFTKSITTHHAENDFNYANSNFVYLALAASKASDKNYQTLVQTLILKPLQLKHTFFLDDLSKYFVLPISYAVVDGVPFQQEETNYSEKLLSSLLGAGDLLSTASDLDTYFDDLVSKLLSNTEYQRLFHQQAVNDYQSGIWFSSDLRTCLGNFNGQGIRAVVVGTEDGKNQVTLITNQSDSGDLTKLATELRQDFQLSSD